jgi:hypothetical protein
VRYLHPVSMSEVFVAGGVYHHEQPDGKLWVEESWTIHEFPDGAWMIRVDHDRRTSDGVSVLIEAWRSPIAEGAKIERFDISAFGTSQATVKHARCTYSLMDDSVEVGRSLDGADRQYETLLFQKNGALYPGGHLFMGLAYFALEEVSEGSYPFLMPDWHFHGDEAFSLYVSKWHIQRGATRTQIVDGVEHSGTQISFEHQKSDATMDCLIDAFGILLHGNNDKGVVSLSRYARRQSPSK